MRLYHFTTRAHIAAIRKEGILYGDVPTGPNEGFNAPWLTTEHRFSEQGWTRGSVYDKAELRLAVEIPADHPNLYSWEQLVDALEIPGWWVDALENAAGRSMKNDYVYLGGVPPEWITKVEPRPVAKLSEA
jgi:hypothetical protein